MIINKMFKLILNSFFLYFFITSQSLSLESFDQWLNKFQIKAIDSGISEKVVKDIMSNAKYLPKVIEYDRYQPEFYEDTFTYIKKRSSNKKVKEGLKLSKEKSTIETIENVFQVVGIVISIIYIETNFKIFR